MTATAPDTGPEPAMGRSSTRHRSHGVEDDWSLGSSVAWAISDAFVLTWRNALHTVRVRALWPVMILQPLMFVLLFAVVFGGAIPLPGGGSYREYMMAGVFAQAVAFQSMPTSLGMAYDMQLGLMDRLRTLPIHPAAIFIGRTLGDVSRLAISIAVMGVCGLAVGWRIRDGIFAAIGAFALIALFGYAMSWVGCWLGLRAKSIQAAQSLPMLWLFPLTFLSSAFVPTRSLPQPLETFAEWNPVSAMAAGCRDLFGNPNPFADPDSFPAQHPVLLTVLWALGLTTTGIVLCTRRMRTLTG